MWFETMQFHMGASTEWLIRALNADIIRENRMASECMDWALRLANLTGALVRKQFLACAAAAMCNATLLASEVISLGGAPPALQSAEATPASEPAKTKHTVAGARRLVQHYHDRIRMAERLGLPGLREVFREIARTKTYYLEHARIMATVQQHAPAQKPVVRIAVPTDDGRSVAPRLRHSAGFLVYEVQDGAIKGCEFRLRQSRGLAPAGCEIVMCAGAGRRAGEALRARGVSTVPVQPGGSAGALVAEYVAANLA